MVILTAVPVRFILTAMDRGFVESEHPRDTGGRFTNGAGFLAKPDGEAQVFYHGTGSDFEKFDLDMTGNHSGGDIEGIWFSDSRAYAEWVAAHHDDPHVKASHLKLSNPLVYDIVEEAQKAGFDVTDPHEAAVVLFEAQGVNEVIAEIADNAKDSGHDGLIIKNFEDGFGSITTAYLVFDTDAIESAENSSEVKGHDRDILRKVDAGQWSNTNSQKFKALQRKGYVTKENGKGVLTEQGRALLA